MVNEKELIERDLRHVWHPCSQMKDFEACPPVIVNQAQGSYLYTNQGPVIDAISSWWCKSLGHRHPAVIQAIQNQLDAFEHVIGANTTYPGLVELAEQLTRISGLQHVFFASDGSSAVEIAMKLAVHAQQIQGHSKRNQFIALTNGYHGETLGALSVSDLGLYKQPFLGMGVACHFLKTIPYVSGPHDPLWQDCSTFWPQIEDELNVVKDQVCAIILEPIVQGAGGMRSYSADFLKRLARWAKRHSIYLLADEIMTGLGRTGEWLACNHAGIQPDLICLSKGLTSGSLPLSCVLIDSPIYDLFYNDYATGQSFLHSHTYSGHPLAVQAALATLKTMHAEAINQKAQALGQVMRNYFNDIAAETGVLHNVRSVGAWVAGDLAPLPHSQRTGYLLFQEAIRRGALIRPLGNTLYWLPPLTTDLAVIAQLAEITLNSIKAIY